MTRHVFRPVQYYTTLGPHDPALHIADGDTVSTTTLDAFGVDDHGEHSVPGGGNPQTGPFFVEGAEPGDTLAVRLDHLAPNREIGITRSILAPNVIDPMYPDSAWWTDQNPLVEWRIDGAGNTATLIKPDHVAKPISLPLSPMIGCFGVAPAGGESIAAVTSGRHGGNMDYRGFREGVSVYFPVGAPGALFFLGDGHALQGDGEIIGTGIEVTFDVQFTVHVIKHKQIGWPRGEDAEYVFTVGNARPLDQALQHATTEMVHLLQEDYGLDRGTVSLLMGMCVRYEVGNVFDPAYTMVCKMPKHLLER